MLKSPLVAAALALGVLSAPSIASAAPLGLSGSATPHVTASVDQAQYVERRVIRRGPYGRCRMVTTFRVNRFGERVRVTRRVCR